MRFYLSIVLSFERNHKIYVFENICLRTPYLILLLLNTAIVIVIITVDIIFAVIVVVVVAAVVDGDGDGGNWRAFCGPSQLNLFPGRTASECGSKCFCLMY